MQRHRRAQVCGGRVFEMMSLIDDETVIRRQHRGLGPVARDATDREIRQQQVVIDDDHVSLRRFSTGTNGLVATSTRERPPQIIYPPEGAQIELGKDARGAFRPLIVKMQAGRAPFRWLANGKPASTASIVRFAALSVMVMT